MGGSSRDQTAGLPRDSCTPFLFKISLAVRYSRCKAGIVKNISFLWLCQFYHNHYNSSIYEEIPHL